MKKSIPFLILFFSTACIAQGFNINLFKQSTSQILIEETVTKGLFIVESSYQFEDTTGQRFGLDSLPYFNRKEQVGCLLDENIVVPITFFQPWQEDDMAKQYMDEYRPVLHEVKIRAIENSEVKSVDSTLLKDTTNLWEGYTAVHKQEVQGFMIDTTSGNKDGWLVFISADHPNTQCIHKPIEDVQLGEQIVTVPSELSEVIGGVYVVPVVERVGQIIFKLCGVIRPSKGGRQLTIMFPFVNRDYKEQLISKTKKGKLIPIAAEEKPGKKLRSKRH